jgi:hypothetical protein
MTPGSNLVAIDFVLVYWTFWASPEVAEKEVGSGVCVTQSLMKRRHYK